MSESQAIEEKQQTVRLIIKRQASPDAKPYVEAFDVPYRKNMNVISCLMEIQRNPVNAKGEKTTPVSWEQNCLEEVCGACSMMINGHPRQACSALVDKLEKPIKLAPMSSAFPVQRDLVVDRERMFNNLKRAKAWIPIDGTYDLGPGPRMAESERQIAYEYAKCMTCGVCLEACPNVNMRSDFMGPQILGQVRLFNSHPTGKMNAHERLAAIMGKGGIVECGNAQNCVQACPKGIPLTTAIAELNRATTGFGIKRWLAQ